MKEALDMFGLGKERVWFRFISASEGKLFAQTVEDMVQVLRSLGPNPLKRQWEI